MRWLLCLLLLLTPTWVQGQPLLPPPTPITIGDSPTPITPPDGPLSSPKRTLDTFLSVMATTTPWRPDLEAQARECLDLSQLNPLTRSDKGSLLAYKLYSILQTIKHVPDLTGSSPITIFQHPEGQLQLAVDSQGNWRFTPDSINNIESLFSALHTTHQDPSVESSPWQKIILNAPVWKWSALALWFILGLAWERIISFLVQRFVAQSRQKLIIKPTTNDLGAPTATGRLIAVIWWMLGITLLQPPMELTLVILLLLRLMCFYYSVLASFRWLDLAANYFINLNESSISSSNREMFVPLLRRTCKTLAILLLLSILGRSLSLDITGLLAGFSILGAMVALAGQDTIKNIFGSLTVLVDKSFQVGDRIIVQGIDGIVEELGFRSTRIRTSEDTLVTLPNSLLLTSSVDNWGRRSGRRFSTGITVDYASEPDNIEKFCQQLSERLKHLKVATRNISITASDLNDSGIRFTISLLIETDDLNVENQIRHSIVLETLRYARKCSLIVVYPSQRIIVQKPENVAVQASD